MSPENPIHERSTNFIDDPFKNKYKIKITPNLISSNKFYLVLESLNPNFIVSILKPDDSIKNHNRIMDLVTNTGNIMMAMSD